MAPESSVPWNAWYEPLPVVICPAALALAALVASAAVPAGPRPLNLGGRTLAISAADARPAGASRSPWRC